jgi:NAD(P)-dependent dehydrogenase (short-subunit alcohol dehydrogenase family)
MPQHVKIAVVTGAGSGVGRAVALRLTAAGYRVIGLGRQTKTLQETVKLAGAGFVAYACDVGDAEAVQKMAADVSAQGTVEVLVNAAGTNVPQRALEVLGEADYKLMIDANMNGPYYVVQAFLPGMRERGRGTIVNVISDAALAASPKAGPGYVMSKFGLRGLTQAINAEERGRGVRATSLLPGDIDTPLLLKRPAPPTDEARAKMLKPEDVADCAMLCINLPPRAIVEELLVRPA